MAISLQQGGVSDFFRPSDSEDTSQTSLSKCLDPVFVGTVIGTTLQLNSLILVSVVFTLAYQMFPNRINAILAFPIFAFMSVSVPPYWFTILPRNVKLSTSSFYFVLNLTYHNYDIVFDLKIFVLALLMLSPFVLMPLR